MTDNPHGAALAFLAVLAYPDSTADRDKFIAAGRCWILRQLPPGPKRDDLAAHLPAMRLRDIDSRLERGLKRIRTRRRWAAAELQQELLRDNPRRGRKSRVTALAGLSARNTNDRNASARVWKESLGVLHLAYVMEFGEALTGWRHEKAAPAHNLARERTRLANATRQRGPNVGLRFNVRINYKKPTGSMDPLELIARPAWIASALAEAENVRCYLVTAGTVSDRDSIALLPQ